MSSTALDSGLSVSSAAKRRVAAASVLLVLLLFAAKLAVGLYTHSLGILAEAGQTGVDLIATLMVLVSIAIADRPADADHPFGHGKFENFSAFLEAGLLLITGFGVAYDAAHRLLKGGTAMRFTVWALVVMAAALLLTAWRARALMRAARRYQSPALEADALNFRTDVWTSGVVLVGLLLTGLGQLSGRHWLFRADAAAALAVGLAMLVLAWNLARRTAGVLLDEAPRELIADLRREVLRIEGVEDCERLRLRRSGSGYFIDLRAGVARTLTLERARQVRDQIAERIRQLLPGADIVIDTLPRSPVRLDLFEQIRAIVQSHNLGVHEITILELEGALQAEFHLELPAALPLRAAHDRVSRIESEIRRQIPAVHGVLTHIEPEGSHIVHAWPVNREAVQRRIQQLAREIPGMLDCHDLQLRSSSGHFELACHCSFPDHLDVGSVHDRVTRLEASLKRNFPELIKVTIHTEPVSDNRR